MIVQLPVGTSTTAALPATDFVMAFRFPVHASGGALPSPSWAEALVG